MIPLLGWLASAGLGLLKGAVEAKGKEVVEKAIGVKIPSTEPSPEQIQKLRELEMEHEEELLRLSIQKQELDLEETKVLAEVEKNENDNVSKRWESDMASDSWLSKNVRPVSVLAVLLLDFVMVILAACKIDFATHIVELVSGLNFVVLSAYFGGRSVEKVMSIKSKGGSQ